MNVRRLGIALLLVVAATAAVTPAAHASEDELDPIHHSADGYYLDFLPIGKIELPRIFVVQRADGSTGLDVFGSTKSALSSGMYVAQYDEAGDSGEHTGDDSDAHATEPGDGQLASGETAPGDYAYLDAHLEPAGGGHVILDLSITRHLVFAWIGMLLVIVIFLRLAGRYKKGIGRDTAPKGGFQNAFEALILFVRDEIARPNLGPKTDKYLPYLLTVFFFILFCNYLGLVPFGATATSNIMVTSVLAIITFLLTQLGGSRDYWAHIFWPPGVPWAVKPILIPVEILGLFTKPFALAVRLFANMTAGHLIILSLIGLIFTFNQLFGSAVAVGVAPVSVAFALFIYVLELLVAFIQAYVFTMLSALFIGMAVAEHDHHHDEHAAHDVHAAELAAHAGDGTTTLTRPEPALVTEA